MAKKSKVQKRKVTKKRKSRKNPSLGLSLLLAVFAISGVWFMSSALLIIIGLLPMFVAFFVDKSAKKTKAVTVGAMNIAGIMPFLMELWMGDNSMEKAVTIIMAPMAIIVVYSAAGVGYIIDWAGTMAVASFMYQRGVARKKAIE